MDGDGTTGFVVAEEGFVGEEVGTANIDTGAAGSGDR